MRIGQVICCIRTRANPLVRFKQNRLSYTFQYIAERCHRITIPDGSDYGLLENDAALLLAEDLMNLPNDSLPIDTFSVEIKPKQGWSILDSNILQLFNINVDNLKKCRFCAMQFLKVFIYLMS